MALDSAPEFRLGTAGLPASAEKAPSSLLGALVFVASYRQTYLSTEQLVDDHLPGPGEPPIEKFLHVAEASGLRAEPVRLGWDDPFALDRALPAIVLLRSGSAMVLTHAEAAPQRPIVTLLDPNAHDDAALALDEERFAAWTGDLCVNWISMETSLREPTERIKNWTIGERKRNLRVCITKGFRPRDEPGGRKRG